VVSEHRDRGLTDHGLEIEQSGNNRQTLLLVDVGSRRFAMPIALVSRLEEIKRSNVETADGREVVQYRDTILQLVRLSELLDIPSTENVEAPMQVLVYQQNDRLLGLVVDQIADIADAELDAQHDCRHDEFQFSAVVNGRVTDMLNLPSILRLVDGNPREALAAV
jgi:two-component system chemotaxis sensor kinase CheA